MTTKNKDTVAKLLKAGKYDYVSEYAKQIADTAILTGEEPEFEFLEFDHDPTSDEVLAEIERRGLERPTVEDALRYGATKWNGTDFVVFLHEPWRRAFDRRHVLCLDDWYGVRRLIGSIFDGGWDRRCRFPARRPRGSSLSEPKNSELGALELPAEITTNGFAYKRI